MAALMLRHHNGTGRLRTIPADWAAHHQPVVAGTMLDGVAAIRVPGETLTWSDELERNIVTGNTPYAQAGCRVQALNGQARTVSVAEDEEVLADYLIVIPAAIAVREGHLVDLSGTDDPDLNGRTLRVERVVRGTHRFERDLFCNLTD